MFHFKPKNNNNNKKQKYNLMYETLVPHKNKYNVIFSLKIFFVVCKSHTKVFILLSIYKCI